MFDVIPFTSPKELDCGATCLKMLLNYYGADAALDNLIQECGIGISGCSGADINRAGRAHGLDMQAYRMDADELIHQDRPAIIWWKYIHWCVFCGTDENGSVVIANPDRGRFRMSRGMFAALYTGVALFNGEPETVPEPEEAGAVDYESALGLLGVEL